MGHETRRDVGGKAAAGGEENGKGGEGEDPFGTQVKEKHITSSACAALWDRRRVWPCQRAHGLVTNRQTTSQTTRERRNRKIIFTSELSSRSSVSTRFTQWQL
jgi:hypothetical protein